MSKKVYVIGPSKGYARWVYDYSLTDKMEEADIVFLTGGEDICPSIYHREKLRCTGWVNPSRDDFEIREYKRAIEIGVPLISGTCRGLN